MTIMAGPGSDARHRLGRVEADRRIVWTACGIRTATVAGRWDYMHWAFATNDISRGHAHKPLRDCEGCKP